MESFHLSHIPPMHFNSILSAILKHMSFLSIVRPSLNREYSPFMPYYFESILLKDMITKYIYICLTLIDCIPSAINKWNDKLSNVLVDDLCVHDIFNVCFRATNDSSVNWLQYMILHRFLPV